MQLGIKIRELRKTRGLTQESLAEQMGVSVGAVSKWESGTSCPELPMLMKLAGLFEISLDALTGFSLENKSREEQLSKIKAWTQRKEYGRGAAVEEILGSYPNDFDFLFAGARFYHLKGVERQEKAALKRAIPLYQKAIQFLSQNQNPKLSQAVLENSTAQLLLGLDQYDEALELLKKNNQFDINNLLIAQTMVNQLHQYEEALPLFSQEIYLGMTRLFNASISFAAAYRGLKRYPEALDILQKIWPYMDSFRQHERPSIFDKVNVIYRTFLALVRYEMGQENEAVQELRLAKAAALRFDREPNFDLTGFPHFYLQKDYFVYDDFGSDSLAAISSTLEHMEAGPLHTIWETIRKENEV